MYTIGSIFRLQMGVKTWIVISDPTIAHELLVGNGNITSGRPFSVLKTKHRSMNGRYIINNENQDHEWGLY